MPLAAFAAALLAVHRPYVDPNLMDVQSRGSCKSGGWFFGCVAAIVFSGVGCFGV